MADPQTPELRTRPAPAGAWPKNTKMWTMAAAAVGLLLIILFSGQRQVSTITSRPAPAPEPSRPEAIRGLQQRLDDQARRVPAPIPVHAESTDPRVTDQVTHRAAGSQATDAPDELKTERRRRDYESLFASNVVQSQTISDSPRQPTWTRQTSGGSPSPPSSTEELAALLRAMRQDLPSAQTATSGGQSPSAVAPGPSARPPAAPPAAVVPDGPLYLLTEGRFIDSILLNRLEGSVAGPVMVMVSSPVYAADHQTVIVPVGSRILGKSTPVQAFGQNRLAVTFHRLQLPDGRSYSLENSPVLDQIGQTGLHDKVNSHFLSTLAASAAVGVISGLAQSAAGGYNRSADNGSTVVIQSTSDAVAQATAQTMSRYLNRMPEITIREGHEVKVFLTSDLQLPAYRPVLR